jgi:hypothetical protein
MMGKEWIVCWHCSALTRDNGQWWICPVCCQHGSNMHIATTIEEGARKNCRVDAVIAKATGASDE